MMLRAWRSSQRPCHPGSGGTRMRGRATHKIAMWPGQAPWASICARVASSWIPPTRGSASWASGGRPACAARRSPP